MPKYVALNNSEKIILILMLYEYGFDNMNISRGIYMDLKIIFKNNIVDFFVTKQLFLWKFSVNDPTHRLTSDNMEIDTNPLLQIVNTFMKKGIDEDYKINPDFEKGITDQEENEDIIHIVNNILANGTTSRIEFDTKKVIDRDIERSIMHQMLLKLNTKELHEYLIDEY